MEYFFVLGRNPALSYAELVAYFESHEIKFEKIFFERNILIVSFEKDPELDIQIFGGLIKVGRIQYKGDEKNFRIFIMEDELIESDKFTYSVIGHMLEEILSDKFKREKRKAMLKRGRKQLNLQKDETILIPNADIEFFCYEIENTIYFGKVEQDYSYAEIKERDMKKPIRRESLAISPRLAKILINLSQVREGDLLVDPFCGVGGILQEALLKKINCYGLDKDSSAIESARKNLRWIEQRYELESTYKLTVADSRRAPNIRFDGIATEPDLGMLVRNKPSNKQAQEILKGFETLITAVLKRMNEMKKPGAKLALTMPFIRDYSVDLNSICQKSGLKISNLEGVNFPIKEFRDEQFIGREIVVLE
jgi:tRNA G10  N-methylase Trm11